MRLVEHVIIHWLPHFISLVSEKF